MMFYPLFKLFISDLKNQGFAEGAIRRFLGRLQDLPQEDQRELPLLGDLGELLGLQADGGHWGPFRQGLQRRYLRIRFVCAELARLDFSKVKPGTAFQDFVFDHIDFSLYRSIGAEEFSLFSPLGLEDFADDYLQTAFSLDRRGIAALIKGAYCQDGDHYTLKQEKLLLNPLLMAIMRTLHSSLRFAPLLSAGALERECPGMLPQDIQGFYGSLLKTLDGARFEHPDGMQTALSLRPGAPESPETPVLMGIFRPGNKAYTIALT